MKPAPFDYAAPDTLAEVLDLLAEHGSEARILAGGQTLGPMLNMRMASPALLIDINRVRDVETIVFGRDHVGLGPLVRQREAADNSRVTRLLPLVAACLPHVGHWQTRNRGTVCGSIAHADPTAELPLALLTLGGEIHLTSKRRRRRVPVRDFYLGALTTTRNSDELITRVDWPVLPAGTRFAFDEIEARRGHVAVVACAIALRLDDADRVVSVAVGLSGITDRPVMLDTGDATGCDPDSSWRSKLAERARATLPFMDDLHASAAYRQHVTGWIIERQLSRLLPSGQARTPR